jgi:hypothetical protein
MNHKACTDKSYDDAYPVSLFNNALESLQFLYLESWCLDGFHLFNVGSRSSTDLTNYEEVVVLYNICLFLSFHGFIVDSFTVEASSRL